MLSGKKLYKRFKRYNAIHQEDVYLNRMYMLILVYNIEPGGGTKNERH